MRSSSRAHAVRFLAVPLLAAGSALGIAPAAAAGARPAPPGQAAAFTVPGALVGVAATTAANAWAVGESGTNTNLIVHWNGTRWSQVPSPSAVQTLTGVAATSAANAWAVGVTCRCSSKKSVIEHWDGTRWKLVTRYCFATQSFGILVENRSERLA